MEIYDKEQDEERKLDKLEPVNADDLVVDENPTYAISLMKDFFKNRKIIL